MHLAHLTLGMAALALSCGRVTTLSVIPSPSGSADSAHASSITQSTSAVAAVDRMALRYGLSPRPGPNASCVGAWMAKDYDRTGPQQLHICARSTPAGTLEVIITEFVGWSPKVDSLRHELADTLARFGTVRVH